MTSSSVGAAELRRIGGHRAAIRRVGEALVARHAEIARGMVARIVDEVPAYRRVRTGVIEDVLVLSTATAELLGRALADGSQIRREDVPIVREHAARRVHQGVSLDAFLHAYRAALFGYWDACAEEASRLAISRDASLALAAFSLDAIDTMTTHAAEGYIREETRVRTQSGRAARDLVERLIRGQPISEGRRHPAAPGLDPTAQLLTIVGRLGEAPLPVGDALQLIRDELQESMSLGKVGPLVVIRHGEMALVVASAGGSPDEQIAILRSARQDARDAHGIDVRYGVSSPSPGFPGVRRAYREAELCLSYTSSGRPIVSLQELSSLECAVLGADTATRAVIASKGRELLGLSDQDLSAAAEMIRAFARADLNVARAAEQMHVHPNTVRYRLQRLATTTGHDPRSFAGLVELTCLLEVHENDQRDRPRER